MHSVHPQCGGYCPADTYREDIMDVSALDQMHLITVISLRHPPYLCTQDGVSPCEVLLSPGQVYFARLVILKMKKQCVRLICATF